MKPLKQLTMVKLENTFVYEINHLSSSLLLQHKA